MPSNKTSSETIRAMIRVLPHGQGLPLPAYSSPEAAGADLVAAIDTPVEIAPMQRVLIPAGFCMAIPVGLEAQIRPRSGLALKHGLTVVNAPGTIDSDYRGEVKILLINLGDKAVPIERGMRIAQMVFAPVTRAQWAETLELPQSVRSSGGFGSTGS